MLRPTIHWDPFGELLTSGAVFEDVDLLSGEWAEYDEKGNVPVLISNLKSKFDVVKG
ncbi:hypothetical protein RND81_14G097000 [Saponaria officinalis]|uniref:Uncharacterized protein n=1 Tax=Saponaria officinalis TaxID=3572 RepID=A0AAW1GN96_SAPOF